MAALPRRMLLLSAASRGSSIFPTTAHSRAPVFISGRRISPFKRETRCFASSSRNIKSTKTTIISYLTDVEGDRHYLDRYVQMSKVLCFQNATPCYDDRNFFPYDQCIDFMDTSGNNSTTQLVFGGDTWDKGGGDLYVMRQLLQLKQRYPDRVTLIAGNRDLNKLRILQELGMFGTQVPHHKGVNFLRGTGIVGDPDHSEKIPTNAVDRLKWMFSRTMGSPDAFELRRSELQQEQLFLSDEKVVSITDQQVVESYQQSCHPDGELGQFLQNAQLCHRTGPILFVHGGLPLTTENQLESKDKNNNIWEDLAFAMPWLKDTKKQKPVSVDEWFDELNVFMKSMVQQWKQCIQEMECEGKVETNFIWSEQGGYDYGPPYSQLIQYGMGMLPDKSKNPTVVYSGFWSNQGMPHTHQFWGSEEEDNNRLARVVQRFFETSKLQLMVVGHQPQGDMPSVIRVDTSTKTPAWILCCDTSYSGDTHWHDWSQHDNYNNNTKQRQNLGRGDVVKSGRGEVAVSEVLMELESTDQQQELKSITYHGVLSDGSPYETINLVDSHETTTIGQLAPPGAVPPEEYSPHEHGQWWTKMVFRDGGHLYHAGEGFNVWNYLVHPSSSSQKDKDNKDKSN